MQWQDEAIIISVKPFSEKEALVEVFSHEHGVYRSIAKQALSSKQRGIYQPGNLVFCRWNARLPEQMGTIACELLESYADFAMQSADTLQALNSVCSLLDLVMHERDAHPRLYERVKSLLQALAANSGWQQDYALFEKDLLSECGFGLDLSECASTGERDNLVYVSPKSGRAVSAGAGEPYKDRLFALPAFLIPSPLGGGLGWGHSGQCLSRPSPPPNLPPAGGGAVKPAEILDALRITGYFINEWLLAPHDYEMPPARTQLIEKLEWQSNPQKKLSSQLH
ncbi:MAG: DNA repair protein RecO [Rickettsiales bacterium]